MWRVRTRTTLSNRGLVLMPQLFMTMHQPLNPLLQVSMSPHPMMHPKGIRRLVWSPLPSSPWRQHERLRSLTPPPSIAQRGGMVTVMTVLVMPTVMVHLQHLRCPTHLLPSIILRHQLPLHRQQLPLHLLALCIPIQCLNPMRPMHPILNLLPYEYITQCVQWWCTWAPRQLSMLPFESHQVWMRMRV